MSPLKKYQIPFTQVFTVRVFTSNSWVSCFVLMNDIDTETAQNPPETIRSNEDQLLRFCFRWNNLNRTVYAFNRRNLQNDKTTSCTSNTFTMITRIPVRSQITRSRVQLILKVSFISKCTSYFTAKMYRSR